MATGAGTIRASLVSRPPAVTQSRTRRESHCASSTSSPTATVDHALTDHLSVKAEVVYQEGNSEDNTDNQYFCGDSCNLTELDRRQVLLGAQMTYEF